MSTSDKKGAATDRRKSGTNRLLVTEERSLCREGLSAVRKQDTSYKPATSAQTFSHA